MAELLKDIYSPQFFKELSKVFKKHIPDFDEEIFLKLIYDEAWPQRELKARMRHIAIVLKEFLPDNFKKAAPILHNLVEPLGAVEQKFFAFGCMFLPDYVEVFGIEDFKTSVELLEHITPLVSAEFAVRPFLKTYPDEMMAQMLAWASSDNHHVRRLASEGARPRLPWAMGVPFLKREPEKILPILELLKNDESEYVRRSVANNLNDISKDFPDLVLKTAREWRGKNAETDRLLKHACRTLLKAGNREALELFGLKAQAEVANLQLHNDVVPIGGELSFQFDVALHGDEAAVLRLEYAIDYAKARGKSSRKVFKISERLFEPSMRETIRRRQTFKDMTTRKHYAGEHTLSVIVNGVEMAPARFWVECGF
jgi:3-methyladenine DNA glycosylase AlkC